MNVSRPEAGSPRTSATSFSFAAIDETCWIHVWPDGEPKPVVATLNALDGSITNNMAIVPTTNGSIDAYASGITQLILDISSYFAP